MRYLLSLCLLSLWISASYAQPHYIAVIDAGSSGSRIHVYRYTHHNHLQIREIGQALKVTPGLSAYAKQPDAATNNWQLLLNHAQKVVEQDAKQALPRHSVPLLLMGTAGMRLLARHAPKQALALYQHSRTFIQAQHNLFNLEYCDTISGQQEGVNGWIDANYVLGNFDKGQTTGTLDMGGASTQITYATDQSTPYLEDLVQLDLFGRHYRVFSHSFLGLGEHFSLQQLADPSVCYPQHTPAVDNAHFDKFACAQQFRDLLTHSQYAESVRERLPSIPKTQKFLAFSGYYYTFKFFSADHSAHPFGVLDHALNKACLGDWQQLQVWARLHHNGTLPPTNYLQSYCPNAIYQLSLLTSQEGYGFPLSLSQQHFHITGHLTNPAGQKVEVSWALGAAVNYLVQT